MSSIRRLKSNVFRPFDVVISLNTDATNLREYLVVSSRAGLLIVVEKDAPSGRHLTMPVESVRHTSLVMPHELVTASDARAKVLEVSRREKETRDDRARQGYLAMRDEDTKRAGYERAEDVFGERETTVSVTWGERHEGHSWISERVKVTARNGLVFDSMLPVVQVSWSAIGSVSIEEAKRFRDALSKAIAEGELLRDSHEKVLGLPNLQR